MGGLRVYAVFFGAWWLHGEAFDGSEARKKKAGG